jgi:hypothetical protein
MENLDEMMRQKFLGIYRLLKSRNQNLSIIVMTVHRRVFNSNPPNNMELVHLPPGH